MLQKVNSWPAAFPQSWSTALRAPLVATATNPGVLTMPCGVWIRPTRAREPALVEAWTSSKRKKSLRS